VTVNLDDVRHVEAAASLDYVAWLDDGDNDHQSLSSSASDIADEPLPEVDLMLALRRWNIDVQVSRHAMCELQSILQDAGHEDLPKDWRTVLNRCALEDAALRDDSLSERSSQRQSYDTLTLVCGACWLAPFSKAQLEAALTCATCGVLTVQCSRLSCRERCVVITRLGKKSLDTLQPCSVCLMSSTSFSTHSAYHWSLKRYI